MPRPTLDDIFAEPDEFGLLDIKLSANGGRPATDPTTINREIEAFRIKHGRLPDPEALDHEEKRLGTIRVRMGRETKGEDEGSGLIPPPERSWRDDPLEDEVPNELDDIFGEDRKSVV